MRRCDKKETSKDQKFGGKSSSVSRTLPENHKWPSMIAKSDVAYHVKKRRL